MPYVYDMAGSHPDCHPYCTCGKKFTIDHALSCPCGGLPTIRHNEIRDLTTNLITEVCSCVGIEPMLQPLSGEL